MNSFGAAVYPEARKKGLYTFLFKHNLLKMKELGIRRVTSEAMTHSAAPILKPFGFKTEPGSSLFEIDI